MNVCFIDYILLRTVSQFLTIIGGVVWKILLVPYTSDHAILYCHYCKLYLF